MKKIDFKQKSKALVGSLVLSLALSTNANASGIPTVDMASITQAIMGYTEQLKTGAQIVKQYEQQLKEYANSLMQSEAMGVGQSIMDALGEANNLINTTMSIIDNYSLDFDILQRATDIQNACSYIGSNSKKFNEVFSKVSSLTGQIKRCLSSVDTEAIADDIADLMEQLSRGGLSEQEIQDLNTRISNLNKAVQTIQAKTTAMNTDKVLTVVDAYENGDKNNPYSKERMDDDLKTLLKQVQKADNDKERQALTNVLLAKHLEMTQKQYEATLNFSKMMAQDMKNKTDMSRKDYQETPLQVVDYEDTQAYQDFKSKYGTNIIYNEFGMPDFNEMTKVK